MGGQTNRLWMDYKYNGCLDLTEDTYFNDLFEEVFCKEECYDSSWEEEWNSLYDY